MSEKIVQLFPRWKRGTLEPSTTLREDYLAAKAYLADTTDTGCGDCEEEKLLWVCEALFKAYDEFIGSSGDSVRDELFRSAFRAVDHIVPVRLEDL